MVAASLANMRQGSRTDLRPSANLPEVSQPQAAALLNVSERALRSAAGVRTSGEPELIKAVEQGKLSVSAGEKAARLAPQQQRDIAEQATAGDESTIPPPRAD